MYGAHLYKFICIQWDLLNNTYGIINLRSMIIGSRTESPKLFSKSIQQELVSELTVPRVFKTNL